MAKRQVVSLDTSTPQLVVPQTGDNYQLVRDVFLTTGIMKSEVADGASAVGFVFDTENSFANASAKIASFKNAGTEKAYIDKDGNLRQVAGVGLKSAAGDYSAYYDSFQDLTVTARFIRLNNTTRVAGLEFVNYSLRCEDGRQDLTLGGNTPANSSWEAGDVFIKGVASPGSTFPNGGNVYIRGGLLSGAGHNGYIMMDQIPSSDPGVPGAIYRTAGALMVSI